MVPAFTPLTYYWYDGVVPPLVGVAINVTGLPGQKGFADAAITRLTGKLLLVVIDSVLLVIGFANGQSILEVNSQFTWSPLRGT